MIKTGISPIIKEYHPYSSHECRKSRMTSRLRRTNDERQPLQGEEKTLKPTYGNSNPEGKIKDIESNKTIGRTLTRFFLM